MSVFTRRIFPLAVIAIAIGACAPDREYYVYHEVNTAPPPVRYEAVPVARPGYVWSPGYWGWEDGRYGWVEGSWLEERPGYVWVPARWEQHEDRWHFEPGRWSGSAHEGQVNPHEKTGRHRHH